MKNRKKMAGTIVMIMALSLGYNAGGPVVVHAHENAVITEKLGETAASQEGVIDFSAIKDNEDLEVAAEALDARIMDALLELKMTR